MEGVEMEAIDQIKALRVKKGKKFLIRVGMPDGQIHECGGNRAERAKAVIVVLTHEGRWINQGCRADLAKAQQEAHRMTVRTTFRVDGATFEMIPAVLAKAVPVEDAQ